MDWTEGLDAELKRVEALRSRGAEDRSDLVKGLSIVYLNVMVRFALDTSAEMKMLPNQWEIATYHGGKRWELRKEQDFGMIDEIVIADDRPRGCAMITEFYSRKGFERVRSGFLLPESLAEKKKWLFYVAGDSTAKKASVHGMWIGLRKGVEEWYESLLRDDTSSFRKFCEVHYAVDRPPAIPDNL